MHYYYKNDTSEDVKFRCLLFKPGQSRRSYVLLQQLAEAVDSGDLNIYIDEGEGLVLLEGKGEIENPETPESPSAPPVSPPPTEPEEEQPPEEEPQEPPAP